MASQSATLTSVKGTLMVSKVLLTYQLRSKTKIQAGRFTAIHLTMAYTTPSDFCRSGPTTYSSIVVGKPFIPAVNDSEGEGFIHIQ